MDDTKVLLKWTELIHGRQTRRALVEEDGEKKTAYYDEIVEKWYTFSIDVEEDNLA